MAPDCAESALKLVGQTSKTMSTALRTTRHQVAEIVRVMLTPKETISAGVELLMLQALELINRVIPREKVQ